MSEAPSPQPIERRRSRSLWPALFAVSLALLIAVASFGAGMLAERAIFAGGSLFERAREVGSLGRDAEPVGDDPFPRLTEVQELIEDEYYYRPASPEALPGFRAELDRNAAAGMATAASAAAATPAGSVDAYLRELEYGALRGMAAGLGDDHTAFLEPVAQAPVAEQMSGEYEGIGVWVERPGGAFVVSATFPDSPAEEAGLRPGDAIEAADGRPLAGIADEDALRLIRGPAGTRVRLLVRRPGQAAPFDVEVERRAITTPVVTYRAEAGGRVAHVAVSIFNDKTTGQLDAAVKRAKDEGVGAIVLDLRNNGGGWVTTARETIGRFVPEDRGPALYEDEDAGAADELTSLSILGGGEQVFDLPLVVLVDGGTASAAEIVAGALRDYERAPLVGTATFGKGSVQQVHDFDDGSSLRLTSAAWLTPNKEPIPEEGLAPDVVVDFPVEAPEESDPQLARAVELVLAGG
ncbi:MAG: S41 family peptidase [Chloroflexota bacterium]|nr:S41 family peptidase [Chloroflexota bacterium]